MNRSSKLLLWLLLILIGFLPVAELVFRPGHPVTFDGHVHMTTMNQYAQALQDSEFPVTWSNNFANYGLPLPLFAHQLPAYLGAFLILLGFSTEVSFIILLSLSVILSTVLFFIFCKKFTTPTVAFTATVLSSFSAYKVVNIYTRGALPELLATVFLPLLFLGIWNLQNKKYYSAALLLFFGTALTALTHPMLLVLFALPVGLYFFSIITKQSWKQQLLVAGGSSVLGCLTAGFYLIPLVLELKYFYQAGVETAINSETFLSLKQLYDPTWYYTLTHPGPRGNYVKLGTIEFMTLFGALLILISSKFSVIKKRLGIAIRKNELKQFLTWVGIAFLCVMLVLPVSKFLYQFPPLNQIQYPWRFLTILQFVIPILFIFSANSFKKLQHPAVLLAIIATTLYLRIPQFYGKNYVLQPESDYEFTQSNLHSDNLNPVWTGKTEEYPKKTVQAEVIEGTAQLEILEAKNASRTYGVTASTQARLVDYTFYFPGWNVYLDGSPVTIEYQDPNYRGMITYTVPQGAHTVTVMYEYTKVRTLGVMVSIVAILGGIVFLYQVKTNKQFK